MARPYIMGHGGRSEAIERQKAMREQAQPQINALQERRTATAPTGVSARAEEGIPPRKRVAISHCPRLRPCRRSRRKRQVRLPSPRQGASKVDRAVKLLEMSQQKTDDPYYTVAIWLMIEAWATASGRLPNPSWVGERRVCLGDPAGQPAVSDRAASTM
jgi:hypothetical protein